MANCCPVGPNPGTTHITQIFTGVNADGGEGPLIVLGPVDEAGNATLFVDGVAVGDVCTECSVDTNTTYAFADAANADGTTDIVDSDGTVIGSVCTTCSVDTNTTYAFAPVPNADGTVNIIDSDGTVIGSVCTTCGEDTNTTYSFAPVPNADGTVNLVDSDGTVIGPVCTTCGGGDGFTDPTTTNALDRSTTQHFDADGVLVGETCNAELIDLVTDDSRNTATGLTCGGEFKLSVIEERSRQIATAAVNDLLIDNAHPTTTFFVTNANGGINGVDPVASAAAQLGPIVEDTLISGGSFRVDAWWAYWVDANSENGGGVAATWVDPSPNADPLDPSNGWPHGKPEIKLEISVMPTAAGVYSWANMRSDGVNQNNEFETGIYRPGTAPLNPISGNPLPEGTRYPLNYGIGDQNTYLNVWHSEDDTGGERIHRDTSGALLECDIEYTIAVRQVLLKSVDLGFFSMSNWEARAHTYRIRRV